MSPLATPAAYAGSCSSAPGPAAHADAVAALGAVGELELVVLSLHVLRQDARAPVATGAVADGLRFRKSSGTSSLPH